MDLLHHRKKRKLQRSFRKENARIASNACHANNNPRTFEQFCKRRLRSRRNEPICPNPDSTSTSGDESEDLNVTGIAMDAMTSRFEERLRCEKKYRKQVTRSSRKRHRKFLDEDNREIKQLSALLGIDDERKQYQSGFYKDGLDELLQVCKDEEFIEPEGLGSAWTGDEIDEPKPKHKRTKLVKDKRPKEPKKCSTKRVRFCLDTPISEPKLDQMKDQTDSITQTPLKDNLIVHVSDQKSELLSPDSKSGLQSLRAMFNRLNSGNIKWALAECRRVQNASTSRHDFRNQFWAALRNSALPVDVPANAMPDILFLEHAGLVALVNALIDQQTGPFILHSVCSSTDIPPLSKVRMVSALCTLKLCPVDFVYSLLEYQYTESSEDIGELCFSACRICPQVKKSKDIKVLLKKVLSTSSQRCRILAEECLRKDKATNKKDAHKALVMAIQQHLGQQPLASFTGVVTFEQMQQSDFSLVDNENRRVGSSEQCENGVTENCD